MAATTNDRSNPDYLVNGKYITCFEEPDIIYMKFSGVVSTDDALELLRRQMAMGEGKELLFFLIDAEDLETISPEGRRAVAETLKVLPLRGMAVVQAPLKARVVTKLVITAINLFRKDAKSNPVEFFNSEEEAREWIAQRREQFKHLLS